MNSNEFNERDYEIIARESADLREAVRRRCANEEEFGVVQNALDFANEAHKNVRRRSGEPYIIHPIAVAKIVVKDIGLGYRSIAAALLHDVVEDTDISIEDIQSQFGDKIASLVEGLTKIKSALDNKNNVSGTNYTVSLQAKNFRHILLTMNDDVRVVLIKLADRLHNCRTIEYMPEYKRDKILSETMYIFIPLAHRLGLYEVKSEMENIWLRYKEPDAYNTITAQINSSISDKEKEIDEVIAVIRRILDEANFNYVIRKRVKTPYSIWYKMREKKVSFDQIYDLYAIRIIFTPEPGSGISERDQCYLIFSRITDNFPYVPERVRDWVKTPKSNGYEALHCTINGKGNRVEVQIRSKRMDDIAEKGIAAHWAYKKDGWNTDQGSEMDKWLARVKEIIVSPNLNAMELLDIIHNDLVAGEISVFTPRGEQKSIKRGATALDFAYLVHTDIGNRALAAKVNKKLVPLSYVLKGGDQVEIIFADNGSPKKEWLSYLQTRHARNVVMDYFRTDKANIIESGRQSLAEQFHNKGLELDEKIAHSICSDLELNSPDELYFRYSLGLVGLDSITESAKAYGEISNKTGAVRKKRDATYTIFSNDGFKYVIASCCNPIPGDTVIGFLSPDGVISIHKKACTVADSIATKHGDWIVHPQWKDSRDRSFLVKIEFRGIDRMGLINDITICISLEMGVDIRKLNLSADKGLFEGFIAISVSSRTVLDSLMKKLEKVNGVREVMRSDILV